MFKISSRTMVLFDDTFFYECRSVNDTANFHKIKYKDIFTGNYIKTSEDITISTGYIFNRLQLQQLQRAGIAAINRYKKEADKEKSAEDISSIFSRYKKGSKIFKNIITYSKEIFVPHCVIKFASNTDCIISKEQSKKICSLWTSNYLSNELKTFCFKLHNNTLGYNYTVSKFIHGHEPYCTFCTLARDQEDSRETPLHLFHDCMHTELIFENFFRTFLGNEYATFTRRRYFGGDSTGNLYKDNMINFLSLIFKFYIWKCKLCFKVPDAESAESFTRRLIQDTYNNNNFFRKNWNESGLQYRF